ncbi:hypothetical protein [Streptomyces sp. Ru73]|uniref:hypothetical protein n=1 Tax=Streptomyces sp. Ru73 TaxID=2080748 RepID=UPI002156413D|nr:hypothetical protein [Streptomyces sp. Ru73]
MTEHPERPDRAESADEPVPSGPAGPGAPPAGPGNGGPAPRPSRRRRWLSAFAVLLLIVIPAGYLALSAAQSRDSGQEKEERAAMAGLTWHWPSKVQRRIYDVRIPAYSYPVAFFETNSFKTSSLYVTFRTSQEGLDQFLANYGRTRDDLKKGDVTIPPDKAKRVKWDFSIGDGYAGLVHHQKAPRPTQRITVDFAEDGHPVVYVLSTTRF